MNVTVENLSPCKMLMRFEVDPQTVIRAWDEVVADYAKRAALPGFRAGKAPRDLVEKQFAKEIEEEARRKLVRESYQHAVKERNLAVLGYPDIEEIQFHRGQTFTFAATIETSPSFEMPKYRGLSAKRELVQVTDQDVDQAVEALRVQKADFNVVDRPAQEEDIAVIHYKGTCEGQPINEVAPAAQGLAQKSNFWVAIKPDSFIPGFTQHLVGAKAGEHRTIDIGFPQDFVSPQLAGKRGIYEVDVVEIRERALPALDADFARQYGADSIENLRRGVRQDLQNERNSRQRRSVRNQIVRALLDQVSFELPESFVTNETRNVVYEIVQENQKRGVSKEAIDQNKSDIYAAANATAKDRVKLGFLIQRISDQEGIRVSEPEVQSRVVALAQSYQMPAQKFMAELQKRDGLPEIYQQLVHEKVLNFLQEHAKIEDAQPAQVP